MGTLISCSLSFLEFKFIAEVLWKCTAWGGMGTCSYWWASEALNSPLEGITHSLSEKDGAFLCDCYKPQTVA